MAASQAKLNRGRIIQLGTAAIAAAPTDGLTTFHFRMSPKTPTGNWTTGLFIGAKAPTSGSAVAIGAGFSLVMWVLNPVTLAWFSTSTTSIAYDQAFVTFDFNASGMYLQVLGASVVTPGNINFHTWEQ